MHEQHAATQLWLQCLGVGVALVWASVGTWLIMLVIGKTMGARADKEVESRGLDAASLRFAKTSKVQIRKRCDLRKAKNRHLLHEHNGGSPRYSSSLSYPFVASRWY